MRVTRHARGHMEQVIKEAFFPKIYAHYPHVKHRLRFCRNILSSARPLMAQPKLTFVALQVECITIRARTDIKCYLNTSCQYKLLHYSDISGLEALPLLLCATKRGVAQAHTCYPTYISNALLLEPERPINATELLYTYLVLTFLLSTSAFISTRPVIALTCQELL